MVIEPGTFVATLERLWAHSSLFLWAVAGASLCAFAGVLLAGRVDAATFGPMTASSARWLLPVGLGALVLAGSRTYHEPTHRAVRFVANENQSFVHVARQPDESSVTQIRAMFEVLNVSDDPIYLPEMTLVKPRTKGEILNKMFLTRQDGGSMFGQNVIPAYSATEASAHIMVRGDVVGRLTGRIDLKFRIRDQFGRRYVAVVRGARIN